MATMAAQSLALSSSGSLMSHGGHGSRLAMSASSSLVNGTGVSSKGTSAHVQVSLRRTPAHCCSEFHGSGVHASSSSVVFNLERSSLVKKQVSGSQRRPTRGQRLVVRGLFGLGVPELAVIAGVAAILFGPKQLPEIGKSLGKTVKSFQQAAKEFESEVKGVVGESTPTESSNTETSVTPTSTPPPPPAPAPTTSSTSSEKDSV